MGAVSIPAGNRRASRAEWRGTWQRVGQRRRQGVY